MTSNAVDGRESSAQKPEGAGAKSTAQPDLASRPEPASEELRAALESVFAWCCRLHWAIFAAALCAIAVLRSGWGHHGKIVQQLDFARQFPVPSASYKATSVVGPTLAWLFGVETHAGWRRLHVAATALCALLAAWLIVRLFQRREERRGLAILLIVSPLPIVLLQLIGSYDVFTLLAALLLGLAAGRSSGVAAGVLAGLANGEQGFVIAATAACVGFGLHGKWSARTLWFAAGCVAARLFVWRWLAAYDFASSNRATLLDDNLLRSLESFARLSSTATYTWYGPLWLVVGLALWMHRRQTARALALFGGLVLLPAVATIFTLDGTRVFVCCSLAALCVLLRELVAQQATWTRALPLRALLGALVLALPILPAYMTWLDARIRIPFAP